MNLSNLLKKKPEFEQKSPPSESEKALLTAIGALTGEIVELKKVPSSQPFEGRIARLEAQMAEMRALFLIEEPVTKERKPSKIARKLIAGMRVRK